MRVQFFLALVLLGATLGLTRAEDKPLDKMTLDKRIVETVYESAKLGTDIFNAGNHEGCYRLYQGTLMALAPMLDYRPKLQTMVKMRLERATKMRPADAAFELRTALDEIQNDIAPPKKKEKAKETTLWERLGGEKGVSVVIHDIVLAAAEDKKVNFLRDGKVKLDAKGVEHLEKMLVEWVSAQAGGPLKYEGKSMKDAHKGMAITNAEFDAMVDVIVSVLKKHKVSDDDIATIKKVVEGTRKDIVEMK